jgi:hypothetical protein
MKKLLLGAMIAGAINLAQATPLMVGAAVPTHVPDAASTAMLLSLAFLGISLFRRK